MQRNVWTLGILLCLLCGCAGPAAVAPTAQGALASATPTDTRATSVATAPPAEAATATMVVLPTAAPTSPVQTIPAPPTLPASGPTPTAASQAALQLHSEAFDSQGEIPPRHTCSGENLSPALYWDDAPAGTQAWALIMDDPDAVAVAGRVWDHWLLYNLPAGARSLPEGVPSGDTLADGSLQGANSSGRLAYDGPCPPKGAPHHYAFRLYALDQPLDLAPGATKDELLRAIAGHTLAQAELVGLFQR